MRIYLYSDLTIGDLGIGSPVLGQGSITRGSALRFEAIWGISFSGQRIACSVQRIAFSNLVRRKNGGSRMTTFRNLRFASKDLRYATRSIAGGFFKAQILKLEKS